MIIKTQIERLMERITPPGDMTIWCYVGYGDGPEFRRVPGPHNVYHIFIPDRPAELPQGLMVLIEPDRRPADDDPVVPLLTYALVMEAASPRQRRMLRSARSVVVLTYEPWPVPGADRPDPPPSALETAWYAAGGSADEWNEAKVGSRAGQVAWTRHPTGRPGPTAAALAAIAAELSAAALAARPSDHDAGPPGRLWPP
jgi:hypothetical protein